MGGRAREASQVAMGAARELLQILETAEAEEKENAIHWQRTKEQIKRARQRLRRAVDEVDRAEALDILEEP